MTEIDKKNLKNYLYFTFGITYIAWDFLPYLHNLIFWD